MKNKIIDLATTLFMTQGYPATSTRQIAKELGITQPAIYHHFKNKQTIYLAVLNKFSQEVGDQLLTYIHDEQDSDTTLLNMSIYLKHTHPMNLSLMLRDVKTQLDAETSKAVLAIWQKNYLSPFEEFFSRYYADYNEKITAKNLSLHYLRGLSTYIDGSPDINDQLMIEFVDIFIYGVKRRN